MHGVGSRNKLTPHQEHLYAGETLLDRLGRAVCGASALPRKELHEAWEVAKRVRRQFRGGRVVDLCCGYGMLAQVMLLVDDTATTAIAVDVKPAPNHLRVHEAIVGAFPQLRDRVQFVKARLEDVEIEQGDVVVSAHACGSLTDAVLTRASDAGARVAVLPCCHEYRRRSDLAGWTDPALAMDLERAATLRARGYRIWTKTIPADVSPKNRLLLGAPLSFDA